MLLLAALAGCQTPGDIELTEVPEGTRFTPVGEAAGFDASGELVVYPHNEMVGGGLASFAVHIRSMSDRELRNVRTAIFYPREIVQVGHVFEPYLVSPHGYDLSPAQPSYGLGQTFSFSDWEQADAVLALAEQPIRLRVAWDGGQRFLEIPPEAISVTQENEPRRLPNDPHLFAYPTHTAFVDHEPYSEGRYRSRASGITAAELLDWYRGAMAAEGWEAWPAPAPPDRALVFRKDALFVSLAVADAPGGAEMWSNLRSGAELTEDEAIRIARARYPEDLNNQWTAEYHEDGLQSASLAAGPVWEVKGLWNGEVWVTAWVDAVTAQLLGVQQGGE